MYTVIGLSTFLLFREISTDPDAMHTHLFEPRKWADPVYTNDYTLILVFIPNLIKQADNSQLM